MDAGRMRGLLIAIGFLAGLIITLVVIGVALNWLYFRLRRRRAERAAEAAAARIGLARRSDSEPHVPVWTGQAVGQPVAVAAHAWGSLDEHGPHFSFFATPMVAIVAPIDPPLPMAFVLSTGRGATSTYRTGDVEFDQHFQIEVTDVQPLARLLESADLKRSIAGLLGPSTFWSGSGRIVEITRHGVIVRETSPGRRKTAVLATQVLAVAAALRNRSTFLGWR
jgi:hypothetical protein